MRNSFAIGVVPRALSFLAVAVSLGVVACNEDKGPDPMAAPEPARPSEATNVAATVAATADPAPTANEMATAAASASAAPLASGSATAGAAATSSAHATASVTPTGSPAASGSAAAGAKTFDCGEKGQKLCPMQAWMKGVMGAASSSGDTTKLAAALEHAAGKAPPGMGSWSSIARAGAAKAKAGDLDGAKASCKQCHDQYKATYKATMRDRAW